MSSHPAATSLPLSEKQAWVEVVGEIRCHSCPGQGDRDLSLEVGAEGAGGEEEGADSPSLRCP